MADGSVIMGPWDPLEECRQVTSAQRMPEKHHIGVPLTEGLAQEPGEEVMPELTGSGGQGAQASIVSTDTLSRGRTVSLTENQGDS